MLLEEEVRDAFTLVDDCAACATVPLKLSPDARDAWSVEVVGSMNAFPLIPEVTRFLLPSRRHVRNIAA